MIYLLCDKFVLGGDRPIAAFTNKTKCLKLARDYLRRFTTCSEDELFIMVMPNGKYANTEFKKIPYKEFK